MSSLEIPLSNTEGDRFSIIKRGNIDVFRKDYSLNFNPFLLPFIKIALKSFRTLEDRILIPLKISDPGLIYLDQFTKKRELSTEDIVEEEKKTNEIWRQHGIPTPEILSSGSLEVLSLFIESKTYHELIGEEYKQDLFDEVLRVYHKIRQTALSEEDSRIFHSDPHLSNFIRSSKNNKTFVIDSTFPFRTHLSTEEVDSYINGFFAFQLYRLDGDLNVAEEYLNQFFEYLSAVGDKDKIKLPRLEASTLPYVKIREELAYRIGNRRKRKIEKAYSWHSVLERRISP